MHDSATEAVYSLVVSKKGPCYDAVARVTEALSNIGHAEIVAKSDQEPALVALVRITKARWEGDIALEESPVYTPACNGAAERALKHPKSATSA